MQCLTDCHAADYSGMHSKPAVIKLVHHLTEAKQMLTEMQHVSGGNFSERMERSGVDSIMRECHNLISTILNESASIPVNQSDYTSQNPQTGDPSVSHSQHVDASESDSIESPPSHLPSESARVSSMFNMSAKVTSAMATLQPYTYRSKDVDAYIEGLPSAGVYLVEVDGYMPYTYTGQFRDGLPNGRGMAVWEIGVYYEGYFWKGKQNHHGRSIDMGGDAYEGEYHDGKWHGKGTYRFSDGGLYIGEWEHGGRHGKGRMRYSDAGVYEGEWQHNKRHGKGTMIYSNGTKYGGQWQDNYWDGNGTLTNSNGSVYEGEWKHHKWNGQSTVKRKDGSTVTGTWINGKYKG